MSSVRRPHGAVVVLSVRVLLAAGSSPGRADQVLRGYTGQSDQDHNSHLEGDY